MNTVTHPTVVTTIAELRALLKGSTVALVPTMGALHEGHLALVDRAAELADIVVVSIFVNPLQFDQPADLERYPRTLDADVEALAGRGAHYVFAPTVEEMYPDGKSQTMLRGGAVAELLEGRSRPGHFDGMLTVVNKLLNIVQPDVAVFGQKDAQQLWLIQRMVKDLNLPVRIEPVDIVRDADGLALSSRNRFLSRDERIASLALSRALEAAASAGDRGIDAVLAAAQSVLMGEELIEVDYLKVVDPRTFQPVSDDYRGPARALIAARVGATRLIDNESLYLN